MKLTIELDKDKRLVLEIKTEGFKDAAKGFKEQVAKTTEVFKKPGKHGPQKNSLAWAMYRKPVKELNPIQMKEYKNVLYRKSKRKEE